jgi:hypothetical protein
MAHKADSTMGAMADSAHSAMTAADSAKAGMSDSVNKKMEKNPATPPKN